MAQQIVESASTGGRVVRGGAVWLTLLALGAAGGYGLALADGFTGRGTEEHLPPIPFPAENTLTEEKRVLGKILFWDEQLSTDNTMACGTCHIPSFNGMDPRRGRNPGPDGFLNTPDDKLGSPGVISADANDEYAPLAPFGLRRQITPRTAPTNFMSMYAPELFWDGRAGGEFRDPLTGEVLIASGGALENQAIGPVLSDVEMAHADRDWVAVSSKLSAVRPLALATALPPDMAEAIESHPTYPQLFEAAFGTGAVTPARIAFAIATYQRTLFPDQTPWDGWMRGDFFALTPAQRAGMEVLEASFCAPCHMPPMWTDQTFRNIGLRPVAEDRGRQDVTGLASDRGKFKVPTLRNVGLNDRFMHNGQFETINDVFDFYARRNGHVSFADNRDSLVGGAIAFNAQDQARIIDFIVNGLTDPRVAAEAFPFDRPTLHSERAPNPALLGGGTPGTSGFVPRMIANRPPVLGDAGFRVGLDEGLPGAMAVLHVSRTPPQGGTLIPDEVLGPVVLGGNQPGQGFATLAWPIDGDGSLDGDIVFMQWVVTDPAAAGGQARSRIAQLTLFCGTGRCESVMCLGDFNGDGEVDFFDVQAFLTAFSALDPKADLVPDGEFNFFDVQIFLSAFSAGCP